MEEMNKKKLRCRDCKAYVTGGKCLVDGRKDHNALDEACEDIVLPLPLDQDTPPVQGPVIPSGEEVARAAGKEPVTVEDITPMKVCACCGKTKPLTEFVKHARSADGTMNTCKECFVAKQAKYKDLRIAGIRRGQVQRAEKKAGYLSPIPAPDAIPALPKTIVTADKVVTVEKVVAAFDIQGMSDKALFDELRRRGFQGTLTKTVVTEFTV